MTENERLADQIVGELALAVWFYKSNKWTAEQFLRRLKIIAQAANL